MVNDDKTTNEKIRRSDYGHYYEIYRCYRQNIPRWEATICYVYIIIKMLGTVIAWGFTCELIMSD